VAAIAVAAFFVLRRRKGRPVDEFIEPDETGKDGLPQDHQAEDDTRYVSEYRLSDGAH
jgi:hypothetical protein